MAVSLLATVKCWHERASGVGPQALGLWRDAVPYRRPLAYAYCIGLVGEAFVFTEQPSEQPNRRAGADDHEPARRAWHEGRAVDQRLGTDSQCVGRRFDSVRRLGGEAQVTGLGFVVSRSITSPPTVPVREDFVAAICT